MFCCRVLLSLLIVRVPFDWGSYIFDTLAVVPLLPPFVNVMGFSVLCLLLCLLPFCFLLSLPFVLVDSGEVEFDNSAVDIHGDTVYCLNVLLCHVRRGK